MAGSMVEARDFVNLQHLLLTRKDLEHFCSLLCIEVVAELEERPYNAAGHELRPASNLVFEEVPTAACETPKQRRHRLLAMLEAETSARGKRGALARVVEAEKRTRPKADRSKIGKEIKQAREELDEERRGGGLIRLIGR